MACILVYGPSGTGKTTSLRNLDAATTGIISSDMKPLPFKGWKSKYVTEFKEGTSIPIPAKSNYIQTNKYKGVNVILDTWGKDPKIKTIVIDTLTHILMKEYMEKSDTETEQTGNNKAKGNQYQKFTDIAVHIYNIINKCNEIGEHKDVIIFMHNESEYIDGEKIEDVRTVGKLLKEKIDIPSLFTYVLYSGISGKQEERKYGFYTNNDGTTLAKTPMGMFESLFVENDMLKILETIHLYNS